VQVKRGEGQVENRRLPRRIPFLASPLRPRFAAKMRLETWPTTYYEHAWIALAAGPTVAYGGDDDEAGNVPDGISYSFTRRLRS